MGIDLKAGGRNPKRNFRKTRTNNVYLRLLIKLYKFLARRTESKFNHAVYKRLNQSITNRYPISISRIMRNLRNIKDADKKIAVCVCNVLDDKRILDVPKLTVCAIRFSETARKRILAAGGECLTFDQLATKAPTGSKAVLMRGPKSREALKHFGLAPG